MIKSYLICAITYFAALAGAVIFLKQQTTFEHILLQTLIADVIATAIVFCFSTVFKNASLYDAYWSVAPVPIVFFWYIKSLQPDSMLHELFIAAILLWSLRLTYNWLKGWHGMQHEDWRYVMLRQKHGKLYPLINFAGIHLFPTVMVFAAMLPVYYAMQLTVNSILILSALGFIISLSATLIQLIADEQLRSFRKHNSRDSHIETGLWKYSRHPNYLGEILFWFGLWLMLAGATAGYLFTAIGFIAMLMMFVFISIPMMEEKNLKSKPGYAAYMKRVSMLFPLRF